MTETISEPSIYDLPPTWLVLLSTSCNTCSITHWTSTHYTWVIDAWQFLLESCHCSSTCVLAPALPTHDNTKTLPTVHLARSQGRQIQNLGTSSHTYRSSLACRDSSGTQKRYSSWPIITHTNPLRMRLTMYLMGICTESFATPML